MSGRISSLPLQQSHQEKTIGLLAASLLLLSILTLLMLAVWISHLPGDQTPVTRVNLRSEYEQASGSHGAAETARTLEDLGTDDQPAEQAQVAERLQAVSALVKAELLVLDGSGGPAKGNSGIGDKPGDSRKSGPGGPDGSVIPAWERWQIRYAAADVEEYAKILDAFDVELGVMGGGELTISYVRSLADSRPQIRQGMAKNERRLRFIFARGDLQEADRLLARRAGLSVAGRIVGQFYPDGVQQRLERLERTALGTRPLSSVRHTTFGIRRGVSGLEFFVERIEPAQVSGSLAPL